jgi:hypothetical protein
MEDKKYPPITPEKSEGKHMGALAGRAEDERKRKEEALKQSMSIGISLDPEINWIVKTINGKSYLSIKHKKIKKINMKNYTEGITDEMIITNGIDKLQTIIESGFKPRMIVKYKDNKEMIINGDEEITKFVEKLKQ